MKYLIPPSEGKSKIKDLDVKFKDTNFVFSKEVNQVVRLLDLIDDEFYFQLIMPGKIEFSNADSISVNRLFWSFQIEDYMNEDYIISSFSSKNYPGRQSVAIIIILCILSL